MWTRWRPAIGPLPAVVVVGSLAVVAVIEAVAGSLRDRAGRELGLDAYRHLFGADGFWVSFGFSLWVAAAGTVLAAAGAVMVGWVWTSRPGRRRRLDLWVLQLQLSLPHAVWALALAATWSQSGLVARLVASLGLIERPDQFPVLVVDSAGLGIIAHLVTKELPFLALVTLPLAGRRLRPALDQAATLGAGPMQRLRVVYLPAVAPALVPAALAAFAFGLGSYEPAAVLGVEGRRTLSVVAVDRFRDADLAARSDALAIATVLVAIVVVAVALGWSGRRWWTMRR